MGSLPFPAGQSMELTDTELRWLSSQMDSIEGLEGVIRALAPEDLDLLKKGLGASIGFTSLQRITRDIEGWSNIDEWASAEILHYLRIALTGYKIAMSISSAALSEQNKLVGDALAASARAAGARWENDPKTAAMEAIKTEYFRWQDGLVEYESGAAFARTMASRHAAIAHEGSIQNNLRKWRAEHGKRQPAQ